VDQFYALPRPTAHLIAGWWLLAVPGGTAPQRHGYYAGRDAAAAALPGCAAAAVVESCGEDAQVVAAPAAVDLGTMKLLVALFADLVVVVAVGTAAAPSCSCLH
jgi:hypothetical protein